MTDNATNIDVTARSTTGKSTTTSEISKRAKQLGPLVEKGLSGLGENQIKGFLENALREIEGSISNFEKDYASELNRFKKLLASRKGQVTKALSSGLTKIQFGQGEDFLHIDYAQMYNAFFGKVLSIVKATKPQGASAILDEIQNHIHEMISSDSLTPDEQALMNKLISEMQALHKERAKIKVVEIGKPPEQKVTVEVNQKVGSATPESISSAMKENLESGSPVVSIHSAVIQKLEAEVARLQKEMEAADKKASQLFDALDAGDTTVSQSEADIAEEDFQKKQHLWVKAQEALEKEKEAIRRDGLGGKKQLTAEDVAKFREKQKAESKKEELGTITSPKGDKRPSKSRAQRGGKQVPSESDADYVKSARERIKVLDDAYDQFLSMQSMWMSGIEQSITDMLDAVRIASQEMVYVITAEIQKNIGGKLKSIGRQIEESFGSKSTSGVAGISRRLDLINNTLLEIKSGLIRQKYAQDVKFIPKAVEEEGAKKAISDIIGSALNNELAPILGEVLGEESQYNWQKWLTLEGDVRKPIINRFLGFNKGGIVPGTGDKDSIPALLTPGEWIINPRKLAGGTTFEDYYGNTSGLFGGLNWSILKTLSPEKYSELRLEFLERQYEKWDDDIRSIYNRHIGVSSADINRAIKSGDPVIIRRLRKFEEAIKDYTNPDIVGYPLFRGIESRNVAKYYADLALGGVALGKPSLESWSSSIFTSKDFLTSFGEGRKGSLLQTVYLNQPHAIGTEHEDEFILKSGIPWRKIAESIMPSKHGSGVYGVYTVLPEGIDISDLNETALGGLINLLDMAAAFSTSHKEIPGLRKLAKGTDWYVKEYSAMKGVDWKAVAARREFALSIANEPIEHLGVFTPDSPYIPLVSVGDSSSVGFSKAQIEAIKKSPSRHILIHNHPTQHYGDWPLPSWPDLSVSIGQDEIIEGALKSIIVSGSHISSLIMPSEGWRSAWLKHMEDVKPRHYNVAWDKLLPNSIKIYESHIFEKLIEQRDGYVPESIQDLKHSGNLQESIQAYLEALRIHDIVGWIGKITDPESLRYLAGGTDNPLNFTPEQLKVSGLRFADGEYRLDLSKFKTYSKYIYDNDFIETPLNWGYFDELTFTFGKLLEEKTGIHGTGKTGRYYKPYEDLRNRLRYGDKLSESDLKEIATFDRHIRTTSGDVVTALSGVPLFRGIPAGRMPRKGGIMYPDPAYTYMSLSSSTARSFGKAIIKSIITDRFKKAIGYIGADELQFILSRGVGFVVAPPARAINVLGKASMGLIGEPSIEAIAEPISQTEAAFLSGTLSADYESLWPKRFKSMIESLSKVQLIKDMFPQHFASGGPLMPGQTAIVGEEGPEMLIPAGSGFHVINNKILKSLGMTRFLARGTIPVHDVEGGTIEPVPEYITTVAQGVAMFTADALKDGIRSEIGPEFRKAAGGFTKKIDDFVLDFVGGKSFATKEKGFDPVALLKVSGGKLAYQFERLTKSARYAITGGLIFLHVIRILTATSKAYEKGMGAVSRGWGYMLDMIIVPLLPAFLAVSRGFILIGNVLRANPVAAAIIGMALFVGAVVIAVQSLRRMKAEVETASASFDKLLAALRGEEYTPPEPRPGFVERAKSRMKGVHDFFFGPVKIPPIGAATHKPSEDEYEEEEEEISRPKRPFWFRRPIRIKFRGASARKQEEEEDEEESRPGLQFGGKIPGYGGGDIVPILAERGELIVPKEIVRGFERRAEGGVSGSIGTFSDWFKGTAGGFAEITGGVMSSIMGDKTVQNILGGMSIVGKTIGAALAPIAGVGIAIGAIKGGMGFLGKVFVKGQQAQVETAIGVGKALRTPLILTALTSVGILGVLVGIAAIIDKISKGEPVPGAGVFGGIDVWDLIKTTAKSIWDFIKTPVKQVWEFLKGTVRSIWEFVSGIARSIWEFVKPVFRAIWEFVKPAFRAIWEFVKPTLRSIWEFVKPSLKGVWEFIKTSTKSVWDFIRTPVKSIWDFITGGKSKPKPTPEPPSVKSSAAKGGVITSALVAFDELVNEKKSLTEAAPAILTGGFIGMAAGAITAATGGLAAGPLSLLGHDWATGFGSRTGGTIADTLGIKGEGKKIAEDIGGIVMTSVNDSLGWAATGFAAGGPVGAGVGAVVGQAIGGIQDILKIKEEVERVGSGVHLTDQYGLVGSIAATAYNVGTDLRGVPGAVSEGIDAGAKAIGDAITAAGELLSSTVETVKGAVDSVVETVKGWMDASAQAGATVRELILGAFETLGEYLAGIPSAIMDLINKFMSSVPVIGALWKSDKGATGVPSMAVGGHILSDGLVYAHSGETIVPARVNTNSSVRTDTQTANITNHNTFVIQREDDRLLFQKFQQMMVSEQRRLVI